MEKYYTVTVFDKLDIDENVTEDILEDMRLKDVLGFSHQYFGDIWTCGVFPDKDDAMGVVEKNITDIHEDCYRYAIIEEYSFGLYPFLRGYWLYKWDNQNKSFIPFHHRFFELKFQGFTFYK